jgi:hypothetical protein
VIGGVSKVALEVEDQDRARSFCTEQMRFQPVQDAPTGGAVAGGAHARPSGGAQVRQGERPTPPHPSLPTSKVYFYAEDFQQTYQELTARGVQFPQPPVQQPFGWWSLFQGPRRQPTAGQSTQAGQVLRRPPHPGRAPMSFSTDAGHARLLLGHPAICRMPNMSTRTGGPVDAKVSPLNHCARLLNARRSRARSDGPEGHEREGSW